MLQEFKTFAMRGNVVDMAVGIIIGGAFGTIVSSLVSDVLMPPIGMLLHGADFPDLFFVLREGAEAAGPYANLAAAQKAGAVTVNYGVFINNLVSFLIVAWVMFLLVKGINRLRDRWGQPTPPTALAVKNCPYCRSDVHLEATRCPRCTSMIET